MTTAPSRMTASGAGSLTPVMEYVPKKELAVCYPGWPT
jgi:hypothetical protein